MNSGRAAWLFAGAGLLIRVALLVVLASRPLHDDAADYHQMAAQLLDGGAFEPDWPPGLPYYLSLFGASALASRIAMILLYLALCAALFALAKRVSGVRAGNFALAFFALFPSAIFLSLVPLTQLPTALLLALACWLGLRFVDDKRALDAALLGLVLAALLLVRPSNIALTLFAPLLLFAVTRKLSILLLPALAVALLAGAWTLKAHSLTGRWLFINNANSQNLYYGNNPWTPLYRTWWFGSHKRGEPDVPDAFVENHRAIAQLPPGERGPAFSKAAVEHIKARPDLFVVRSLSRVRTFFAFDTFTGAQLKRNKIAALGVIALDAAFYLACALLAICAFFSPPDKRAAWIIGISVLLYAGPYFASFSHPTYHFPVLAPLAALAASFLDGRWRFPERRGWLYAAIAIFVFIQSEWAINQFSRL